MPALRRAQLRFTEVTPTDDGEQVGVKLGFKPERSRLGVDFVEDYAVLGPEHCIPAVAGLGKVLRILKAARVAVPEDTDDLIGDVSTATRLLEKALGTLLRVELRPRSRFKFIAWTENGVETIDDVMHVHESDDAYLIVRRGGRHPVSIARETVVRQQTECERWFEVVSIQRV